MNRIRTRLATALSLSEVKRTQLVAAMAETHDGEALAYWFHLAVSMGIASLGLVLNSSAVVIGAMLIAPLMGPIVNLGMALATGSVLLALRSSGRILGSLVLVVVGSALITRALPFREVTSEILARTSPTLLDLLVATFCALAASFTAVRPGSDTASTAAGASIGIALVPPLCTVGFGLGSSQGSVAVGAALLFTANLAAIVGVAVLAFSLAGFDAIEVTDIERRALQETSGGSLAAVVVGRIHRFTSRRLTRALRLAMPALLLVIIFVPLRRALNEVTWEVTARRSVQRLLAATPLARDAVRSVVKVERHQIELRLIVVAGAEEADRLERSLATRVQTTTGVTPTVRVVGVPDQAALKRIVATLSPRAPVPSTAAPPPVPAEMVPRLRSWLGGVLPRVWPDQAGPLLTWRLDLKAGAAPLEVELVHLGESFPEVARELLQKQLHRELSVELQVRIRSLDREWSVGTDGEVAAWLKRVQQARMLLAELTSLRLCLEIPSAARIGPRIDLAAAADEVSELVDRQPGNRTTLRVGARWVARLETGLCWSPPTDAETTPAAPKVSVPRAKTTAP